MNKKGVFSGNVNGAELNIVSTTEVTPDRVIVEHCSIGRKDGVRDEITDPATVRVLGYLEGRRATQVKAEAHRNRPIKTNFKTRRPAEVQRASIVCPDCDGSGVLKRQSCLACDGNGWRVG